MTTFDIVLTTVLVASVPTLLVLFRINAPYGKHDRAGWGPGVKPRLGWCLMEMPAFVSFLWFYWRGDHAGALVPLVFCLLFAGHYFHRAFLYPLEIRPAPDAEVKIVIILLADVFNAANGYLNGTWLSDYAGHLYDTTWLADPRFGLGIVLFFAGLALNKHSDLILRRLRAGQSTGYAIPYGGGFRFVSNPHYLGELLQWTGFAIASWSPAAMAFVIFSAANLVPRALATHAWYHETFTDYPKTRKALVPYIV